MQLSQAVDADLMEVGPGNLQFPNKFGQSITFSMEAIEDTLASWGGMRLNPVTGVEEHVEGAGRLVCQDVEYIEIKTPGDNTSIVHRPVRDADRRQYAAQYKAWKAGQEAPSSGTPLEQWPGLRKSEIKELVALGIKTVEALAGVSDGNLQNIGMGKRALRDRAQVWLKAASDNAPLEALQAQLRERENQLEVLSRQVAELEAAQRAQQGQGNKGR